MLACASDRSQLERDVAISANDTTSCRHIRECPLTRRSRARLPLRRLDTRKCSRVSGRLIVDPNPLLGTWKLKSYVVTKATGEPSTPYGENPTGYLSYAADGRMQVIGAASGRMVPAAPTPSDNERVALHNTMFAYAGTYSVEAGKVIHHVDISWNELWTGTIKFDSLS